jgi:VWFA-related protein
MGVTVRACAFLLCFSALFGAPVQDAPEITAHQTQATFTSGVNLVSVPVVVRETQGRAVGNLRKEDFRLFDQGKPQIITKFNVNQTSFAPTAGIAPDGSRRDHVPDQFVAYIFDDIHMNFDQLTQSRAATERHLAESAAPNNRAAIATTSGRVWVDFTNDQDQLREALRRIVPAQNAALPRNAGDLSRSVNPCPPDISYYLADQALNYQNPGEIQAAEAAAVACYGPDPNPPALGMAASTEVLSAGNTDTRNTLTSLANLIRRLSIMPGSRSIVLMSSGYLVTRDFYQTETGLVDSAIRGNVILNGLDVRGLNISNTPEAAAEGDAMRRIARGTGGKLFEHDNGFNAGLDQLATPQEYTYVLGFSPQNLKFDGSYHQLQVALAKTKGLVLQARPGYWAPNHMENAAEQANQEIQEAVFSLDELSDLRLDVSTEFFKTGDATAELTVESRLDLNGVKFRAAGGRSEDTLKMVTSLFDQDGHYVRGIQKVIDLHLREETLNKLLASGMFDKETFDVARGRYVVRVVVRDLEGQAMAARSRTVDIQ